MRRRIIILLTAILLLPVTASAQIDAILDAIVGAVEPTPVYDTDLRRATEDLAGKIDRLNNVLFGGAEQNSAAYRYRTMYSDLYDLTSRFSSYVDRSYSNAKRLEAMYTNLDGGTLSSYAGKVQQTWYIYDDTVRNAARIIEQFKKIFSDSNATNSDVRKAAKDAMDELEREQLKEDRRIQEEIETTKVAVGLTQCAEFMQPNVNEYVERGRKTYGTTISSGGSSQTTGTVGTVVMIIIGLMTVIYALFAGFHIMKGSQNAETIITRLIVFFVVALAIILAIQGNI